MTTSTLSSRPPVLADDGVVTRPDPAPRAGGPSRRRVFTPAEKLAHLAAYDAACEQGQGGAYLRREGLYSSHVTEWRRLRDAGLLDGKEPGQAVGRPSKDQVEIARLRRELDVAERRLARTKAALDIMGKAHALLEEISESADTDTSRRKP